MEIKAINQLFNLFRSTAACRKVKNMKGK